YDGAADYNVFEQFIYKVHTWVNDTGFNEVFLKGKARMLYMNIVAPNLETYDMHLLSQELVEYCFQPDIKAQLRCKFNALKQSDRGFMDFIRKL
ncbi:hypothetical protein BDV93DRAFT_407347, partial [Ceratobasidium sp. AG-I]